MHWLSDSFGRKPRFLTVLRKKRDMKHVGISHNYISCKTRAVAIHVGSITIYDKRFDELSYITYLACAA